MTSDTAHLVSSIITAPSAKETQLAGMPTGDQLAVALPCGPTLRGVARGAAASVEAYAYSRPALKTLEKAVWSEENPDRWLTDLQARVTGSVMYYKRPESETRRQIIL